MGLFKNDPAENPPSPVPPGSLEDVARAHAESTGRPPLPPSGDPAKDARRARDRANYDKRKGIVREPRPVTQSAPALFTPETCGALVRLPFDLAGVALQSKSWALDKDEADMVSHPCAETLNLWFPEADPKWAALSALALALLTVTSKKYLIYSEEKREKALASTPA